MKAGKIDILTLVGGGANLLFGLTTCLYPVNCHFGYCIDVSDTKHLVGTGFSIVGILFIFAAFRGMKRDYKAMYICPKCEAVHPYAEVKDEVCPVCEAKMEPLKGFYKRHPERKGD